MVIDMKTCMNCMHIEAKRLLGCNQLRLAKRPCGRPGRISEASAVIISAAGCAPVQVALLVGQGLARVRLAADGGQVASQLRDAHRKGAQQRGHCARVHHRRLARVAPVVSTKDGMLRGSFL